MVLLPEENKVDSEFTWFTFISTPVLSRAGQTHIQILLFHTDSLWQRELHMQPYAQRCQGLGTRLCTLPPMTTILNSNKFSTQLTFELERIWSPQSKLAHMSMFYWLKRRGASVAGQQQSVRQLHAEQVCWAQKAQHLRQLCAGYNMQLLHN